MDEASNAKIYENLPNDNKLSNVPQESFKEEITIESINPAKKSKWFSFRKIEKSRIPEQTISNDIVYKYHENFFY